MEKEIVRKFDTGATRDLDIDKMDYEGFLSPIVLEKYAEYMHKNRFLKDGSMRDSDNWQKGFGDKHLDVCMKSLYRHFMDLWMFHRGYQGRDTIDEAICGILFNTFAYYKKILDDRMTEDSKCKYCTLEKVPQEEVLKIMPMTVEEENCIKAEDFHD